MADEGFSITEEEANKVLFKWEERWKKPRFDEKML